MLSKKEKRMVTKVAEEASELATAAAKLLLWDDADAYLAFHEEAVDLQAALRVFKDTQTLTPSYIRELEARFKHKLDKIKDQVKQ